MEHDSKQAFDTDFSGRDMGAANPLWEGHTTKDPLMDRRRNPFLPSITLDRTSASPLHQQVRSQIAASIRSGIHDGLRMPSTRLLARLLGVSRNTVLAAYDDLVADGFIQGRHGEGMVVVVRSTRGVSPFDPRQVLRDAQY